MNATTVEPTTTIAGATPDLPKTQQRVESLDLIRGIAVMGIVIANVTSLGALSIVYVWPSADGPLTTGEQIAWMLQYMFVDGKMRGVFALLFGVGMAIFVDRAVERTGMLRGYWLQMRRLVWLFAFGIAHYFLLFTGDILHDYAVAGLIVLLFLWLPAKWMFGIAALLFVAYTAFPVYALNQFREYEVAAQAAPADAGIRQGYEAELAEAVANAREDAQVMTDSSLPQIVQYRIETDGFSMLDHPERWLPEYALLMLMGAGLYRMGFFADGFRRKRRLWLGLTGITLSAIAAIPFGLWAIEQGFPRALTKFVFYGPSLAKNLPMILGYVAVLTAISGTFLATGLGERIAAAGRMAFSNYIGTSLVAAVVFQGWGFGLFDAFDKVERLWFVALIWILMLLWSKPWLERFRFGPLEWAWRCLTYWRLFPLRRKRPN